MKADLKKYKKFTKSVILPEEKVNKRVIDYE